MTKKGEIIHFGKYKGQPVEVLQEDAKYRDWLMAQDWFREKFADTYTLIVNNFRETAETPEHNALQAKFTDDGWVKRFAEKVAFGGLDFTKWVESQKWGALHTRDWWLKPAQVDAIESAGVEDLAVSVESVAYEVSGADVRVEWRMNSPHHKWSIENGKTLVECKPVVGDDYPGVLRQMQKSGSKVLLIGAGGYTGTGATLGQVQKIFAASKIRIMFARHVDQPNLP
jgi:hypothetical protein